ncbi:CsgG/HfaB family protein [Pseudogemmobacter sp. W21_MBD1_M6]|uniref:CsgG/HfaB family protein n=1 Tax=Pseudogemmobacter sp. W21_MBD1_M6 TaxID=3240271 RepID=UPI003F95939E
MIGKAFLYVIIINAALFGCGDLNSVPIVSAQLENESLLAQDTDLKIPVSPPIIVGVYNFTDQTGQRAVLDRPTSEMSSAIPQGLSSMLVQELLTSGDGKWFRVVERETISTILNERKVVVAALGPDVEKPLQPLLLPGILITGGAISYDRKVSQRFLGLGFASINGRNEIYSDRVSIALRAVSVQTGEVLESVYVSKEVLSQMNGVNVLKIVNSSTLAVEAGLVSNEPVSVAVRTAISAAVRELYVRGLARGWWRVDESPKKRPVT